MNPRDYLGVLLARLALHLMSDREAWRFFTIQRAYWAGERGARVLRDLL